jgi:hypothetical protein
MLDAEEQAGQVDDPPCWCRPGVPTNRGVGTPLSTQHPTPDPRTAGTPHA